MKSTLPILGVFVLIMGALTSSPAQCQSTYAHSEMESSTSLVDSSAVDVVIEEHIMLLVFDNSYKAKELEEAANHPPQWQDWEDYYFQRESYRLKLEKFISQHWSMGPWWWQTEVEVEVLDELDRGGPINFKVDYPLVDFRHDLVYQVTKDPSGQTMITFEGRFNSQRFGYLLASLIMLITLAIAGLIVYGWARLSWTIFNALVTVVANKLTGGMGHNKWAWRFSACIVGAVLCGLSMIAWAIL